MKERKQFFFTNFEYMRCCLVNYWPALWYLLTSSRYFPGWVNGAHMQYSARVEEQINCFFYVSPLPRTSYRKYFSTLSGSLLNPFWCFDYWRCGWADLLYGFRYMNGCMFFFKYMLVLFLSFSIIIFVRSSVLQC